MTRDEQIGHPEMTERHDTAPPLTLKHPKGCDHAWRHTPARLWLVVAHTPEYRQSPEDEPKETWYPVTAFHDHDFAELFVRKHQPTNWTRRDQTYYQIHELKVESR